MKRGLQSLATTASVLGAGLLLGCSTVPPGEGMYVNGKWILLKDLEQKPIPTTYTETYNSGGSGGNSNNAAYEQHRVNADDNNIIGGAARVGSNFALGKGYGAAGLLLDGISFLFDNQAQMENERAAAFLQSGNFSGGGGGSYTVQRRVPGIARTQGRQFGIVEARTFSTHYDLNGNGRVDDLGEVGDMKDEFHVGEKLYLSCGLTGICNNFKVKIVSADGKVDSVFLESGPTQGGGSMKFNLREEMIGNYVAVFTGQLVPGKRGFALGNVGEDYFLVSKKFKVLPR